MNLRLVAGVTNTLQVRIINFKLSLAKINLLMLSYIYRNVVFD